MNLLSNQSTPRTENMAGARRGRLWLGASEQFRIGLAPSPSPVSTRFPCVYDAAARRYPYGRVLTSHLRHVNAGSCTFPHRRRTMSTDYRNFLALSYEELEELNLAAKADRINRVPSDEIREKRLKYLTDEKRIKAVTVLFSDLEGRFTCSITTRNSCWAPTRTSPSTAPPSAALPRKRRAICASALTGAPSTGCPPTSSATARCSSSASSSTRTERPTPATCAACSKNYADKLFAEKQYTLNAATEIEGFLFAGKDAEQKYHETRQVRVHQHRRLLPLAAPRSAAPVHRYCG